MLHHALIGHRCLPQKETASRRMIQLGQGMEMKVIAWIVHPTPERAAEYGVQFLPLDELLAQADVVSLHVALSSLTEKFIGRQQLELMKPTAILVNTARGAVVDQGALLEALEKHNIAGAGLDVFEAEPQPAGHPITKLDNVVLSSRCPNWPGPSPLRSPPTEGQMLTGSGAVPVWPGWHQAAPAL